jgi:hypothetical protein
MTWPTARRLLTVYQFRTFPLLLPEVSHAQVATGQADTFQYAVKYGRRRIILSIRASRLGPVNWALLKVLNSCASYSANFLSTIAKTCSSTGRFRQRFLPASERIVVQRNNLDYSLAFLFTIPMKQMVSLIMCAFWILNSFLIFAILKFLN